MSFSCMFVCLPHECLVLSDLRGQQRKSDPLGLELWMVLSQQVGAENLTLVFQG